MKRKAILIESSNVAGQSDLPGARLDVKNWQNFLKSDLGGSWSDSEIIMLSKPYSSDVEKHLEVEDDCYTFVAFSGHGMEGSVVLNDHWDNYEVSKLRPRGTKGTLVVDACRGEAGGRLYSFAASITVANESAGRGVVKNARFSTVTKFDSAEPSITKTVTHSVMWNLALQQSSMGKVEMLACAKGQGASEDPASGGFYTSLLLQSADLWQRRQTTSKIHTTKDAHNHAVENLPPQQTPEYRPSNLAFPFAVKI